MTICEFVHWLTLLLAFADADFLQTSAQGHPSPHHVKSENTMSYMPGATCTLQCTQSSVDCSNIAGLQNVQGQYNFAQQVVKAQPNGVSDNVQSMGTSAVSGQTGGDMPALGLSRPSASSGQNPSKVPRVGVVARVHQNVCLP